MAEDLAVLTTLLDGARIPRLVCASGPGRGRHVWIALAVPLPPARVAELARRLHRQLPSLDTSPLCNPGAGCVRPPGAPHRAGGSSRVLTGDLQTLTTPTVTPDAVDRLLSALPPLTGTAHEPGAAAVVLDEDGHPRLRGPRRPLSPASRAALVNPGADASAQLRRFLLGAVRSRWRYRDVAGLLEQPNTAGLEHARTTRPAHTSTRREPTTRIPRPPGEPARVLTRQWARAVVHVATRCPTVPDDVAFDLRAHSVASMVAAVQARADASPGRWSTDGGPADRRVLDALCAVQLEAVRDSVALDIRRLALRCGIGRETARCALRRLEDGAWITQTAPADGPHAATWALTRPTSPPGAGTHPQVVIHARSQGNPPPGHGGDLRASWLSRLNSHLRVAHDVFTPQGAGHRAGWIWQSLGSAPLGTADLAIRTGLPPAQLQKHLDRLDALGLVFAGANRTRWSESTVDRRDDASRRLECAGVLEERARRYALEQAVWAWWSAEVTWRRLPREAKRRRPGLRYVQRALDLPDAELRRTHGRYPRDRAGRPDHVTARQVLLESQLADADGKPELASAS